MRSLSSVTAIAGAVAATAGARPRSRHGAVPSLRAVLALALGGVALASTMALALLVSQEATHSLETEAMGQLAEVATHMAANLDTGMFERWRDIQIAASLDTIRAPTTDAVAKRAVLEQLQRTYPAYSIIVLLNGEGRITLTSLGILEGVDVAHRDYFVGGRHGPFVSDVHEARLMKQVLPVNAREPLRLVDVAAPVREVDGTLAGVLVAHLNWTWARGLADDLVRSLRGHRAGAEILILGRDDTVLLGPPPLQGLRLPGDLAGRAEGRTGIWPDRDGTFLSAGARTQGYRDYPGLGWQVVVRQPASRALEPMVRLRHGILVAGSLVALAAAALAWFLSGRIAGPLRRLADAARGLGRGEPLPDLPRPLLREGQHIAEALQAAESGLRRRASEQRLLIDELNHRVKNTLATVQSLAMQSFRDPGSAPARRVFEARLHALSATHDILTRESWSGAALRTVVGQAVRPFAGDERIAVTGPDVHLPPAAALALAMMIHELCTNAVKYGALSTPGGTVAMAWSLTAANGEPRLSFTWREAGGPRVQPPAHRGFGSRLLRHGFGDRIPPVIAFEPDGLRYAIQLEMPRR